MKTLIGYTLQFTALGLVVLSLFAAGQFPTTPFWVFVLLAVGAGAPLLAVGGRLVHRGRFRKDIDIDVVIKDYRRETFRMAVFLGYIWGWGLLVAAPVFVMGTGLVEWNVRFLQGWVWTCFIIIALACRPLWIRLGWYLLKRWDDKEQERAVE
jgi:hypothetical protein